MPTVQLYSASVCPYAQRSRLMLLEKGVDFTLTEIDLNQKPDWFLTISPYGKVPVLQYGDDRVWESAVINEYLEEIFPQPPLLPTTPGKRAIARIWIDFANTKFTPAFYKLLLSQEASTQRQWHDELTHHLHFIETEGLQALSANGPYWFGENLSLVDLAYYPWFERWAALEHYRHIQIPDSCTRLRHWWATMQTRDSVRATAHPAEYHIQQYARYANNSATGVTAQELRRY